MLLLYINYIFTVFIYIYICNNDFLGEMFDVNPEDFLLNLVLIHIFLTMYCYCSNLYFYFVNISGITSSFLTIFLLMDISLIVLIIFIQIYVTNTY